MLMDRRTAAESALPGRGIIRQNVGRGLRRFSMICCRRNSDRHQSFQRRGEQTVVTPAPAARETETSVIEPSAAPSASERIRQKRGGLHGPEHPDVSETVQTNGSSPDVAMGNAVSPAFASSSGQSGPGEAPVQERLKRVDTDEEMRTGESDVKKPRVADIGALTVCEFAVCEDGYDRSFDPAWDLIPGGLHVAMQNVMTMDIVVNYGMVTSRIVHADVV